MSYNFEEKLVKATKQTDAYLVFRVFNLDLLK